MSSFFKKAILTSPFDVSCIIDHDVNNKPTEIICKTTKSNYQKCVESDITDLEALTHYKLNPSLTPYSGNYQSKHIMKSGIIQDYFVELKDTHISVLCTNNRGYFSYF